MLPRAPATTSTGIASIGVGVLHAFNLETPFVPALALAGDVSLPVGSLAAPRATYAVKALLTKTFPLARLQVNVGGGTWNVRPPSASAPPPATCGTGEPGVPPCELPPIPPDVPCTIIPLEAPHVAATSAARCSSSTQPGTTAFFIPRNEGTRWMAALGLDRALPLASTLIAADIVVERFYGLYGLTDWTAEIGLRRQLTPQLVADVGVGRRFRGATPATSVTIGFTYGMATAFLRGLPGGK